MYACIIRRIVACRAAPIAAFPGSSLDETEGHDCNHAHANG
jgi:hypothetical protein